VAEPEQAAVAPAGVVVAVPVLLQAVAVVGALALALSSRT
jgi:hypothetical protein